VQLNVTCIGSPTELLEPASPESLEPAAMELLEPATSELLELETVEGLEGLLFELGDATELLDMLPTVLFELELTPPPVLGPLVESEEHAITQSIAEIRTMHIKPFLDF